MNRKGSQALPILILVFLLIHLSTSDSEEPGKGSNTGVEESTNKTGSPVPKDLKNSPENDTFNGIDCFDTQENEDKYAFTRLKDDESCMMINETQDIPKDARGTQSYNETCDGIEKKCKRYVRTVVHTLDCFKPTNLRCDFAKKRCVCTANGLIIPEIRFQFGTDEEDGGMNITHGRCLVRPTFEAIPGIDCSPGSAKMKVDKDEETDQDIEVCGCKEQEDGFDSANPNWWRCSKGAGLMIRKELVVGAILFGFMIGMN